MRILEYDSSRVYNRPNFVARLKGLTNLREGIDSALDADLEAETKGRFFIAWIDGIIRGWGLVSNHGSGHLQVGVYIQPEYRRQGIGGAICKRIKKYAALKRKLVHYCTNSPDHGLYMYEKSGFVEDFYDWVWN